MHFAILKAGTVSRRTRERVGDMDRMFTTLLAEPGQVWESFDVEHGQFPEALGRFDGLVITGSAASVYDDAPWIGRLLELSRAAYAQGVPQLGICFGLQICAQALGGAVERNPQGWDIGTVELALTDAGRRVAPLDAAPNPLRILETHADIAVRTPPGATVLARSRRTPVEIFTLGERVLCLQGHPELDNETVGELLQKRHERGLLDAERAAEGRAALKLEPHRPFFQDWLRGYLRRPPSPLAAQPLAAPLPS